MARDSKDLQIIALKDTIKELNITISALSTTVASSNKREQDFIAREAEYKKQIADMKEQLSNMQLPAVQGLAYIDKLFDLEEKIHKKSTFF